MKKIVVILWALIAASIHTVYSQNAPLTTAGTVISNGSTTIVPITVTDFVDMTSCALQLNYNPAIATATLVAKGPLLAGFINYNVSNPGVIIIGWYTFPSDTLADNDVLFNITFSKVTDGVTALTWYDDGYSCYYADSEGILNDTPTSVYYFNGSLTFGVPLMADFSVNNTTPPKNTTVQFTDLTTGSPTAWTWSFDRPSSVVYVNSTNANSQNPQVQFTDGGPYTVTLVTTKTGFTDNEVKAGYIRAGIPGLWTGLTSAAWSTPTNWDNWLVPGILIDVVIPETASYWPIYAGNLTVGYHCKSITLTSSTSQMTITSNLIMP